MSLLQLPLLRGGRDACAVSQTLYGILFHQLHENHEVGSPLGFCTRVLPPSALEVLQILIHREDAVLTMVAQFLHVRRRGVDGLARPH